MKHWKLKSDQMSAVVNSVGAMFGQLNVYLENDNLEGKTYSPLARVPWHDDENKHTLPKILQDLQGEWPCIPFGILQPLAIFPETENAQPDLDACIDNNYPHGKTSNQEWQLVSQTHDHITLSLTFTINDAKCTAVRDIWLDDSTHSVRFKLELICDQSMQIPIGLHPTFALSDQPLMNEIQIPQYDSGATYPITFEPSSQLAVNHHFTQLSSVQRQDNSFENITRLPFTEPREELVQLLNTTGEVCLLRHDIGLKSTLKWNANKLPHCCLWMSCKGRDQYPWNSRHLALGIEPTKSYFDLNPSLAGDHHGLVTLEKEIPFNIEYSITIELIKE